MCELSAVLPQPVLDLVFRDAADVRDRGIDPEYIAWLLRLRSEFPAITGFEVGSRSRDKILVTVPSERAVVARAFWGGDPLGTIECGCEIVRIERRVTLNFSRALTQRRLGDRGWIPHGRGQVTEFRREWSGSASIGTASLEIARVLQNAYGVTDHTQVGVRRFRPGEMIDNELWQAVL